MQPTMGWRFDGRLLIVVHRPENPSNLEWERLMTEETERGRTPERRTLIVSHGGGPDAQQRKRLATVVGKTPSPTAIMTGSAIVRAITSAFTFFNRYMKIVDLGDHETACLHLGLTADERGTVHRIRRELERELKLDRQSVHPPAT